MPYNIVNSDHNTSPDNLDHGFKYDSTFAFNIKNFYHHKVSNRIEYIL